MRKLLASILLSSLVISACRSADPECTDCTDPCANITCSGHGVCRLFGQERECLCDEGYEPDGLSCIKRLAYKKIGVACEQDDECESGFCVYEYCSTSQCSEHADCQNQSDDGLPMCCVQNARQGTFCQKIAEGKTCGDQSAGCGYSCAYVLDSACAPELECLMSNPLDPWAICARPCSNNSDCSRCHCMGHQESVANCYPISGGDTFCLILD